MTTITVSRELLEQALADNTEAQDFVMESIDHVTGLYQGYDEMIERKTRYDRELLERMRKNAAALTAALAQPEPQGWSGIETAPKDGSYFIAGNQHGVWVAHHQPIATSGYRFDDPWRTVMLNHWHIGKEVRYQPATHWMPLPTPPENSNG